MSLIAIMFSPFQVVFPTVLVGVLVLPVKFPVFVRPDFFLFCVLTRLSSAFEPVIGNSGAKL